MQNLLRHVKGDLSLLGYRKRGSAFWKIVNGVYRLIDFQAGAYGDYFFVNVCVHPVGLPMLISGQLRIPDPPKEYECIIRRRLPECVLNEATAPFRKGFVTTGDTEVIRAMLPTLSIEVEQWFSHWADPQRLAFAEEAEIGDMLSVVPVLKEKAFRMLVFFCSIMIGHFERGRNLFDSYMNCLVPEVDLRLVDEYLKSLLPGVSSSKTKFGVIGDENGTEK